MDKTTTILYRGQGASKHKFGSGFYIKNTIFNHILDFEFINERIYKIRIHFKFYNETIVSVYASTEDRHRGIELALEKVCNCIPNYDMKFILGNSNAKLGKELFILYIQLVESSLHNITNLNGKKLVDCALGRNRVITGIWFEHKNIHMVTRFNQIDHNLIHIIHGRNIIDVRSMRGSDIGSDHYLVNAID